MPCPKCGRAVEARAFICPGCEYILDTSFLGEDITDDERDQRSPRLPPPPQVNFGEDAIILGDGQGHYSDFSSKDAGMTREVTLARCYIGGSAAAILHVDCVPEIAPGVTEGSLRMSPFERHVLAFINGKRSIGRLQKKSAIEESDFKTAVAMLADKGIIRQRTTKKKRPASSLSSLVAHSEVSQVALPPPWDRTVVADVNALSVAHARQSANSEAVVAALLDAAALPGVRAPGFSGTSAPTSAGKPNAQTLGVALMAFSSLVVPEVAERERALADDWGVGENTSNCSSVFARAAPAPSKPMGKTESLTARSESGRTVIPPSGEDAILTRLRYSSGSIGLASDMDADDQPESITGGDVEDMAAALRDPTGLDDISGAEQGGEAIRADAVSGGDAVYIPFDGGNDAPIDDSVTAALPARPYIDDPSPGLVAAAADDVDKDQLGSDDGGQAIEVELRTAQLSLSSAHTAPLPAHELLPARSALAESRKDVLAPMPPPPLVLAPVAKAARVPRMSAGSTAAFAQARKAEKIFEQALKDFAEGRVSSAHMNGKLAAMYDPSVETYRAFIAELDGLGRSVKLDPSKPKELTLFQQAGAAEGRGDYEQAVRLFEQAVSMNPKAAALRNRLGVVMSIRLKRHVEALEQLRIAIELEPGNIVYMNNFSKVTALLESQLQREPEAKRGKLGKQGEKIDIKKIRPKMF